MRYLADTTFLIDLVNNNEGALQLANELDAMDETISEVEAGNKLKQA